jgi:hypothetical protein
MAALGLIRGRPWRWDEDNREGQRPHSRPDAIALAATVKVKRSDQTGRPFLFALWLASAGLGRG